LVTTRQLSSEELMTAREMLSQWQLPSAFRKAVDKLVSQCSSADWFNRPSLKFYATERQLLYVAATRARDRLIISGVAPGSEFLGDIQSAARDGRSRA
jgi:ATP-dependent exoDNAse (exonuclease V) beta subunit